MSFLDILLGAFLLYAVYKGLINGLFVELAGLISLIIGVYFAMKFSSITAETLSSIVSWNPKTIQITAFIITFILIVVAISLSAKVMTKIADFAYLGLPNKIGGVILRLIKTVLIISVFINLFEKINYDNYFAKKETLDNSIFYYPIQKTAVFIFPTLENWFEELKK